MHSTVLPNQGQAAADAIWLGMTLGVFDGSYTSMASPDFATAAQLLQNRQLLHAQKPVLQYHPCL